MKRQDFYYDLPPELIAQEPLADRTTSRLMCLDKCTGSVEHKHFYDIVDQLNPGDCLILNDTKVIPARLYGEKEGTGGHIEFLLLHKHSLDEWEVILTPGRKATPGARFVFGTGELVAEVLEVINDGNRLVKFLNEIHHILVIAVRLVHFDGRKFGVVVSVHTFVTENTAHFIHLVHTANDQTL